MVHSQRTIKTSIQRFIGALVVLVMPFQVVADEKNKGWQDLFMDSFNSIYTESIVLHKETLSGCGEGHWRGRFLWTRLEDLPTTDSEKSAAELSRDTVKVRYGEFYYQSNDGQPYLVFQALDFSGYSRELKYYEVCPKNKGDMDKTCEPKELGFAIYHKDPRVSCLAIPPGAELQLKK